MLLGVQMCRFSVYERCIIIRVSMNRGTFEDTRMGTADHALGSVTRSIEGYKFAQQGSQFSSGYETSWKKIDSIDSTKRPRFRSKSEAKIKMSDALQQATRHPTKANSGSSISHKQPR